MHFVICWPCYYLHKRLMHLSKQSFSLMSAWVIFLSRFLCAQHKTLYINFKIHFNSLKLIQINLQRSSYMGILRGYIRCSHKLLRQQITRKHVHCRWNGRYVLSLSVTCNFFLINNKLCHVKFTLITKCANKFAVTKMYFM